MTENIFKELTVTFANKINALDDVNEMWECLEQFYVKTKKDFSNPDGHLEGHTKYLQGVDLPIMVNSVFLDSGEVIPVSVSEMHVGKFKEKQVLLITPRCISLPLGWKDKSECRYTVEEMKERLL